MKICQTFPPAPLSTSKELRALLSVGGCGGRMKKKDPWWLGFSIDTSKGLDEKLKLNHLMLMITSLSVLTIHRKIS